MDKARFNEAHQWVKNELRTSAEFWVKNGWDRDHGGIYTCLDRKGDIYSTDKSVWMQGRTGWVFAYLCSMYGVRKEWLDFSKSCIDFLEMHCINHEAGDRFYFTVTEDGRPLRQRRYMYSEDFYAMANAEYYANTAEREHLERARKVYDFKWSLMRGEIEDPVGMPPKVYPETRAMRSVGPLMIYLNVTNIMLRCDPERRDLYLERGKFCTDEIVKYHYKPELKCMLGIVGDDGSPLLDTSTGRAISPGDGVEGSWFMAEYANEIGDKDLLDKAGKILIDALDSGWDNEYEGLLYYIDYLGKPSEIYEHDMKLWWPHTEMLISTLMFYRDTKDEVYLDWFFKAYEYCRKYFSDPEYGEWFGYLRRDGKPTEPPCKGQTYKGPFHVLRSMILADKLMDEIAEI